MTIDELNLLKKKAALDLTITEKNALQKTLEIPNLYQLYLSHFIKESMDLKKMKVNLEELYGKKFKYYREEYSRELNRGEIEHYIDADKEYHDRNQDYQFQELVCKYLEEITQRMKSLSFDLKNYVDLRLFLGGSK
jgi:Recombination, repair and ssDNA binding protein UvsY